MKEIVKNTKKYWWLVLFIFLSLFLWNKSQEKKTEFIEEELTEEKTILKVDIKGAVKKPGLYEIEEGSRVEDVIQSAGGLMENADTSLINLSQKVTNEMVILVYAKDEIKKEEVENQEFTSPMIPKEESSNTTNKISLNRASLSELMSIPGIGKVKAEAIIQYRSTNGSFKKIEEIQKVKGIGSQTYEKIKDYLTI